MNEEVKRALQNDSLIDITTTGRKTGKAHRIEISFSYFDQAINISGMPGSRGWYANMLANPEFTFHLKQSVKADIPVKATPILNEASRREILARIVHKWDRQNDLDAFVAGSPLVAVWLDDKAEAADLPTNHR